MTIQFNCPHCDSLCAFADAHVGKSAKCLNCKKHFTIPARSDVKPDKVKSAKQALEPVAGFWRAIFIDTPKLFLSQRNIKIYLTLAIMTVIKISAVFLSITLFNYAMTTWFRLGGLDFAGVMMVAFCFAQGGISAFVSALVMGRIYYILQAFTVDTGFGSDKLPEQTSSWDGQYTNCYQTPGLIYIAILFVSFLPFGLYKMFLHYTSLPELPAVSISVACLCIFIFPSAFINISISPDADAGRPDYIFKPIIYAFLPYLLIAILFLPIAFLEYHTFIAHFIQSKAYPNPIILASNILVSFLMLWYCRFAGLFYRHYGCQFKC